MNKHTPCKRTTARTTITAQIPIVTHHPISNVNEVPNISIIQHNRIYPAMVTIALHLMNVRYTISNIVNSIL